MRIERERERERERGWVGGWVVLRELKVDCIDETEKEREREVVSGVECEIITTDTPS
jgi:hypothetical protein